jgi:dTDP-4-dehydrorhamnose reductase
MSTVPNRVLVLGASGMLGHQVMSVLASTAGLEACGTVRSEQSARRLPIALRPRVTAGIDACDPVALAEHLEIVRPSVVVNAVGIVKQLPGAEDPITCIEINALLPHRLAELCGRMGARLVQVSTDCVFSGRKGNYSESDPPDPQDLYGRSKLLGEVDVPHAITLRTSIIGNELDGQASHGLIGWFLNQQTQALGYTRAIFSGLPTVELATVIRDHVLPRPDLHGVYQVAARPISKYELLKLVAKQYGKSIDLKPVDEPVIDRSLNPARFQEATGYQAPAWPDLVALMARSRQSA